MSMTSSILASAVSNFFTIGRLLCRRHNILLDFVPALREVGYNIIKGFREAYFSSALLR